MAEISPENMITRRAPSPRARRAGFMCNARRGHAARTRNVPITEKNSFKNQSYSSAASAIENFLKNSYSSAAGAIENSLKKSYSSAG
jgi:hypothetical protein